MIHLDYRDVRPIYAQIIDGFKEQISAGILTPGDKLPSVRELAGELAINPNTIQRSYRQLEMEGWIVTVPGKGCFVCGPGKVEDLREAMHAFDASAAALLNAGITKEALIARLKGEDTHA